VQYQYKPSNVCSKSMIVDVEDGIIKKAQIVGGCAGNTVGVARLAENRTMDEVISILKGIPCGIRPTSCPDQFATMLEKIKSGELKPEN